MNQWIWLVNPKGKEVEVSSDRLEELLASGYKEIKNESTPPVEIKDTKNSVIFLSEDTQHITGGRYYSWWLATAIQAAGYDVIIYTNRVPVFLDNFKDYPQPKVVITTDISKVDVKGKFYVGSPVVGNMQAIKLGEKYNKPSFCEIFDPFPMMEKYRGNHRFPGWEELIVELKKPHVKIISLCEYASGFIYDWLNKTEDEVFEVYPCINDKARDQTPSKLEKENWVTFVSRLDHHKKINHVLDAVQKTDCELHIIASIDGVGVDEMINQRGMRDQVKIHMSPTDEEKFRIIKKSRVTINGSIFEGFGMWLIESLSCGVPVVCYDYPTFREIESQASKDMIYYADWNNPDDLAEKLKLALEKNKKGRQCNKFNFTEMTERLDGIIDSAIRPKIGVVMIALNEDKFIGASLRSVLKNKNIHKIGVVEGAVRLFAHACNKKGLSVDDTKKEVMKVMEEDEEGKIVYDQYGWATNKSKLRNRALKLIGKGCNYIMVLDADEVWEQKELNKLVKLIKKENLSMVWYPAYHFWKKKDLIAVGSQWDRYLFRFFKYEDKTLHWDRHETPVVNKNGVSVDNLGKAITNDDIHFHHYGYLKDEKRVKEKLEYYKKRDGDKLKVKDTWLNWKPGKETQPTHQGGTAVKFKGSHPEEVKGII